MTTQRLSAIVTTLPVTTAGLASDTEVTKVGSPYQVVLVRSYVQTENSLSATIGALTEQAAQELSGLAQDSGFHAVIGAGFSLAIDSAIGMVTMLATGTPVKTRRSGPMDV